MYCLRWWIPLFLLPFPSTSPFFLVLFLVSLTLHARPCLCCALILVGFFSTSSNWYTFNTTSTLPASSSIDVPATTVLKTLPTASQVVGDAETSLATPTMSTRNTVRTSNAWLDFGQEGGNGFWMPLHRPSSTDTTITTTSHLASPLPFDASKEQDALATFKIPAFLRTDLNKMRSDVWEDIVIPQRIFVGFGRKGGLGVWLNLVPTGRTSTTSA